jgi:hypothetical protein
MSSQNWIEFFTLNELFFKVFRLSLPAICSTGVASFLLFYCWESRPFTDRCQAGMTRIALTSLTVLHVFSQSPHPVHRSAATRTRKASKSMDKASVGHRETQALHPCSAVQDRGDTEAVPIFTSWRSDGGSSASVAQAVMHGKSSQR